MIDGGKLHPVPRDPLAMLLGDSVMGVYQTHSRDAAEADQKAGADEGDLLLQPWKTGILLIRQRIPVFRRTAFDDIGDLDVFSAEIEHGQHVVEQISGPADERDSLQVLLFAGPFSHKHQLCVLVADAENKIGPGRTEGAFHAILAVMAKLFHPRQVTSPLPYSI